jgi:hypothetical protein
MCRPSNEACESVALCRATLDELHTPTSFFASRRPEPHDGVGMRESACATLDVAVHQVWSVRVRAVARKKPCANCTGQSASVRRPKEVWPQRTEYAVAHKGVRVHGLEPASNCGRAKRYTCGTQVQCVPLQVKPACRCYKSVASRTPHSTSGACAGSLYYVLGAKGAEHDVMVTEKKGAYLHVRVARYRHSVLEYQTHNCAPASGAYCSVQCLDGCKREQEQGRDKCLMRLPFLHGECKGARLILTQVTDRARLGRHAVHLTKLSFSLAKKNEV